MPVNQLPIRANFGLLPEPQRNAASLLTSAAVNLTILGVVLYIGMTARRVIQEHKFEQTELIFPTTPPPPPMKLKIPPPPKIQPPPRPMEVKLEAPKFNMPKPEPKPEIKPIQMESKVNVPVIKAAHRGRSRADGAGEAVNGSSSPGRDFRSHAEPRSDATGNSGCHWKSVRRHERPGGCSARCRGIDRNGERNQVRLQRRRSGPRGLCWYPRFSRDRKCLRRRQGSFSGDSPNAARGRGHSGGQRRTEGYKPRGALQARGSVHI